jgi:ABC-2 type transport system ATP-binding protein
MAPVIEVAGLTKYYGKRRGIIKVDFEVREGEVFGFLGPNGAGKTTTIRLLLGFLRPSGGRAAIFGKDCWTEAPAAHAFCSYLAGEPAYWGDLSPKDYFHYLCRLRGIDKNAWRPLAERLDLDTETRIRTLSHGNRQKVGLIQAFMGGEPLLILDEPTTGVDPIMQREFLALVAEAKAGGRTVFLSSHNLPEVERACDRVGIIREGQLVDIASVKELLGEHVRSVNLTLATRPLGDPFDLPDVQVVDTTGTDFHLMVQGDLNPFLDRVATLDVRDMSMTTPDIEDIFLHFYGTNRNGDGGARPRPATAAAAPAEAGPPEPPSPANPDAGPAAREPEEVTR